MAKFSKKRVKTGGRQKGTPNRTTSEFREIHRRILEHLSGQIGIESILDSLRDQPSVFLSYLAKTAPRELLIDSPSLNQEKLKILKEKLNERK